MTYRRIFVSDAVGIIRVHWSAMTTFRNLLEDVQGADGRIEYLRSLAVGLVETIQSMEDSLGPASRGVGEDHRIAAALEKGSPALGFTSEDLRAVIATACDSSSAKALQSYLLAWGTEVLSRFPGEVPNIQGLNGTREVLATLRRWDRVCKATGSDLAFMAKLLNDL